MESKKNISIEVKVKSLSKETQSYINGLIDGALLSNTPKPLQHTG